MSNSAGHKKEGKRSHPGERGQQHKKSAGESIGGERGARDRDGLAGDRQTVKYYGVSVIGVDSGVFGSVGVNAGVSVAVRVGANVFVGGLVGFLVGTGVGRASAGCGWVKVGVWVLIAELSAPGMGVKTGRRVMSPAVRTYWLLIQQSSMPESGLRTKRYAPLSSRASAVSPSPSSQIAIRLDCSLGPARQERPSAVTVMSTNSGKAIEVKVNAPLGVK